MLTAAPDPLVVQGAKQLGEHGGHLRPVGLERIAPAQEVTPVATHARYVKTLEQADAVDPTGRLRCILSIARYTGRRETAVCSVTADAVLLAPDRIGRRLAELGRDEGLAAHMPNGAIHWPGDTDKEGVDRVTPLSAAARAALDAYLRQNPKVGSVPLFPAERNVDQPVTRTTATGWLLKAERRAGLPKLAGAAYHPYRRLWASERAELPDMAGGRIRR
jgi:integrase